MAHGQHGRNRSSYATEALEASDNSPTLADDTLKTVRAQAFAPVSLELFEDWAQILDELGKLILGARDDLEAVKFVTGTGTNEPEGLLTGATNISVVGATFDVAADLYLAENNLSPRFRENAVWFGNRQQYQLIRQFVQPQSSAPIIDHVPGGPTEVIGYTAHEASGMTAAITTGSKLLVLFDPSYYVIVDRVGVDLEVTTPLFDVTNQRPTGSRGILGLWRNTAKLLDPAAARVLQVA